MKIAILCNGPGELWGWARPVVRELNARGHDVLVWLLRCPFSSGREFEVAQSFGCRVVAPMSPAEAFFKLPREKVNAALQLGGDVFWGRRLRAPLFCYTYGNKNGLQHCKQVFTGYASMAGGIKGARVIGDLVKDALALDVGESAWRTGYSGRKIIFLPGSRREIRMKCLAFVRDIVDKLRQIDGFENFEPAVLFSPFAGDDEFEMWQNAGLNPTRTGAGVALREAEYVVTQPGTNTLEIMHAQTRGLVLAPLSFLKEIPVSGLGGLITKIPFIGSKIKEAVLRAKLSRLRGYVSLPNRIAGEMLLDEMVWEMSAGGVAHKIASSLGGQGGQTSYIRKRFAEISDGAGGAAERLCGIMQA